MSDFVAVRSATSLVENPAEGLNHLKRDALFFDQIAINNLDRFFQLLLDATSKASSDETPELLRLIAEIQWLQENNFICNADIRGDLDVDDEFYKIFMDIQSDLPPTVFESFRKYYDNLPLDLKFALVSGGETEGIFLRIISQQMNKYGNVTAIPFLPYSKFLVDVPKPINSDIIHVVVNRLPLPDSNTPWEKIIDYRNDNDSRVNLLNLRRWMRRISSEHLSAAEIDDELQYSINRFEQHMKLHKMKTNTETFESLVKAPLEIIENIVKLRLSKLPEPLFAIRKRKLSLMEAEFNSPGNEIAYIFKTNETFESSS